MVIQFNLQDIPQNVTIKAATLELYFLQGTEGVEKTVLFPMNNSWVDTTTTWLLREGDSFWDSYGGDYDTTISCSAPYAKESGWERFDVTDIVHNFSKGVPNKGFILIPDQKDGNTGRLYPSSEYNSDNSLRPKLTVVYDDVVSVLTTNNSEITPLIVTSISKGVLSIRTPQVTSGVLTIHSLSGRELLSAEMYRKHCLIDLSMYAKGAYLLSLYCNGNRVTKIICR